MKQYLTPDQTAKLIDLGFEKPKNTIYKQVAKRKIGYGIIEWEDAGEEGSYSIGELLSFLPRVISNKKFDYATINIFHDTINWVVGYVDRNDIMRFITSDIELIDALCTLCRKVKVEGVI